MLYKVIYEMDSESFETALNDAAQEGWRLKHFVFSDYETGTGYASIMEQAPLPEATPAERKQVSADVAKELGCSPEEALERFRATAAQIHDARSARPEGAREQQTTEPAGGGKREEEQLEPSPGVWSAVCDEHPDYGDVWHIIADAHGAVLANVHSQEHTAADARLMAAAKDLRFALEFLHSGTLAVAKHALAKARGETDAS